MEILKWNYLIKDLESINPFFYQCSTSILWMEMTTDAGVLNDFEEQATQHVHYYKTLSG